MTVNNRENHAFVIASAICKQDKNSHEEFMRKEINQLHGYSQLHI